MHRLYILVFCFSFLSCGSFKGDKGDRGYKGDQGIAGPQGPSGRDGQNGDSITGPIGPSGSIDSLITDGFQCRGRHNVSYGWYELNVWVYNLSTGERYLHGRSDLHRDNGFGFPDSASFFGDFVETANFRFDVRDDGGLDWFYKRAERTGRLDCGEREESSAQEEN